MFTDRVSEYNAIGCVRLSVGLFTPYLLSELTFDLEFLHAYGS